MSRSAQLSWPFTAKPASEAPPERVRVPASPRVVPGLPPMTEKQLTRAVADAAKQFGWMRYHTHRSDFSPAGWPDEVLCRPPRLVVAELKSAKGAVSDKQQEWLDALALIPGIEVHVWRPCDLDNGTIVRVLL